MYVHEFISVYFFDTNKIIFVHDFVYSIILLPHVISYCSISIV